MVGWIFPSRRHIGSWFFTPLIIIEITFWQSSQDTLYIIFEYAYSVLRKAVSWELFFFRTSQSNNFNFIWFFCSDILKSYNNYYIFWVKNVISVVLRVEFIKNSGRIFRIASLSARLCLCFADRPTYSNRVPLLVWLVITYSRRLAFCSRQNTPTFEGTCQNVENQHWELKLWGM